MSFDLSKVAASLGAGRIEWTQEPWDRRYIKERTGKEPLDRMVVDPDPSFRRRMRDASWDDYDLIVVSFSGGKDSLVALFELLDAGAPKDKIELWHQNVDGDEDAPAVMDWPVTRDYVESVASVLGLPVLYQWRGEGLYGEMARLGRHMHPIYFESPHQLPHGKALAVHRRIPGESQPSRENPLVVYRWDTEAGHIEGRRGMPDRSPNLSQRWCSDVVKIEPFAKAITHDPRLSQKHLGHKPRILVVTGERRMEGQMGPITIVEPGGRSKTVKMGGRAVYAQLEPHPTNAPTRRIVDHWRPVLNWSDAQVWDAMRQRRIRPHPAYELGPWGRCSCSGCIYSLPRQLRGWQQALPEQFEAVASLDETMKKQGRMTWRKGKLLRTLPAEESGMDPVMLKKWAPYLRGEKRLTPQDVVSVGAWEMPLGAKAGPEGGSANHRGRKITPEQAEKAARWLRAPWVCRDELRRGMEVEQEHTSSIKRAAKIALEHLSEVRDYYTRLDRAMEGGRANRKPPRPVPPREAMIEEEATVSWMDRYAGTQGTPYSSRFQPATWAPRFRAGAWRISRWKGLYGHGVEELVELDPNTVVDIEGMVETNEQGRGSDARRYAGWIAEGKIPPPISVIETESGVLRVSDGHRRLAAAKMAGVPVLAWVSWTVDGDNKDHEGRPIATGLTLELAKRRGWVAR